MLPFGVTIPATVPQGSEIPEGLMNNPVFCIRQMLEVKWEHEAVHQAIIDYKKAYDSVKREVLCHSR